MRIESRTKHLHEQEHTSGGSSLRSGARAKHDLQHKNPLIQSLMGVTCNPKSLTFFSLKIFTSHVNMMHLLSVMLYYSIFLLIVEKNKEPWPFTMNMAPQRSNVAIRMERALSD